MAELQLGNDVDPRLLILDATASTYPPVSYLLANCGLIYAGGAGGMSIVTTGTGNLRLYTNNAERLRIPASGEVLINTSTNPNGGQLVIFSDASARPNDDENLSMHRAAAAVYRAFANGAACRRTKCQAS